MKKLITIILLVFTFSLSAQNKNTTVYFGIEMQNDDVSHFSAGYGISAFGNIGSYGLLGITNLDPELNKLFSFAFGVGLGMLAGHLKELNDEKNGGVYNKSDFRYTMYGALAGSFSMRLLLWTSIPEKHLPEGEIIHYSLNNAIFNNN